MEESLNVAHLRRATIVCSTEASVWVLDRDLAERSGFFFPWRYHGDIMIQGIQFKSIVMPVSEAGYVMLCPIMSYQCNVKYVNCIILYTGAWLVFVEKNGDQLETLSVSFLLTILMLSGRRSRWNTSKSLVPFLCSCRCLRLRALASLATATGKNSG